ncbi:hypothetical protein FRC02_009242 [Tulasnella sp. 418]|nr:hypothetical protein FRC02_009242 [Tulasnella sp. 418]
MHKENDRSMIDQCSLQEPIFLYSDPEELLDDEIPSYLCRWEISLKQRRFVPFHVNLLEEHKTTKDGVELDYNGEGEEIQANEEDDLPQTDNMGDDPKLDADAYTDLDGEKIELEPETAGAQATTEGIQQKEQGVRTNRADENGSDFEYRPEAEEESELISKEQDQSRDQSGDEVVDDGDGVVQEDQSAMQNEVVVDDEGVGPENAETSMDDRGHDQAPEANHLAGSQSEKKRKRSDDLPGAGESHKKMRSTMDFTMDAVEDLAEKSPERVGCPGDRYSHLYGLVPGRFPKRLIEESDEESD